MNARHPNAIDMADLPVQEPTAPANAQQARARFFNSGNAFNVVLPPVPARAFDTVAQAARTATISGWFDCDQSAQLGVGFPVTTPLMLARYARVAPADAIAFEAVATASVGYVIEGEARCCGDGVDVSLSAGDVVLLPGATSYTLEGGATGALLWIVGNEPMLAFEGLRPVPLAQAPLDLVHYPAAEIERQLAVIFAAGTNDETSGRALIFSSQRLQASRNLMPTLTLSYNTLDAQTTQPAHRHNSAAITLILQGRHCHSKVAGARCDWAPWSTLVTPPGAPHSHHNEGDARARFLIVQDGGLHYHARTMGFEFLPS